MKDNTKPMHQSLLPQADNKVAAVLAFAAVICAILSLDDAISQHQERAVERFEARMGDLP